MNNPVQPIISVRWALKLTTTILLVAVPSVALGQVAIVADGPSEFLDARTKALAVEVSQLMRDDRTAIAFPESPTHVGNYTLESVKAELRKALTDRKVKAVIGFGLLTGIAVGELKMPPSKPIILPFAAPRIQGLPRSNGASGVRNLAYITGLIDFDSDVRRFREVIRDRKVAFVVEDYVWKTFLKRRPPDFKAPGDGRDDVVVVPVPSTADEALAALPDDVEAVYLYTYFRMSSAERDKLLQGLIAKKIPSYTASGPEWVERGAFITLVPDDIESERYRRVALYLRDALSGERLDQLPTAFPRRTELVINMGTARAIGIYPRFELMTEARLVGQDSTQRGYELTLQGAIEKAINSNPELAALREQRSAAKAELRENRGNLLPQIGVTGAFDWIDPDIASSFLNAERTISVGGSAEQVLYSPTVFNAYFAQKRVVRAREQAVATGRLDLVLEVIQAYLQVLQTEAVERLNRENLMRVRTNRALAELRVEIGASGKQDIARWDIELAEGRADTIQASATRNQAEINLNRTMAAPSEQSFTTVDPAKHTDLLIIDPRARKYIQDLRSFKIYRSFMAQEALNNSPELKQFDAEIEAQDKLIEGNLLQLYIPTAVTSFGVTNVLDRSGVGGSPPDPTFGIPRDDFTWRWGVNLNFTLFDDIRYGTIERLRRTRAQITAQRQDTANRIEQRVRSALHQLSASSAAVDLRRDAVAASHVNLDAVTASYRQGTINIITLIDAQNQALSAEINEANTLYQYLSDYAAAERAGGRFLLLEPPETQNDFFERLNAYSAEMIRAEAQ